MEQAMEQQGEEHATGGPILIEVLQVRRGAQGRCVPEPVCDRCEA